MANSIDEPDSRQFPARARAPARATRARDLLLALRGLARLALRWSGTGADAADQVGHYTRRESVWLEQTGWWWGDASAITLDSTSVIALAQATERNPPPSHFASQIVPMRAHATASVVHVPFVPSLA